MFSKSKQVLGIVLTVLLVCFALMVLLSLFGLRSESGIFGFRPYQIVSDSMKGEFSAGDMIVSQWVDPSDLKENDIITFYSEEPAFYGTVVTHRIYDVIRGGAYFVTKGDANEAADEAPVSAANVLGRYVFRIPLMGHVVDFFFTPFGYVVMILIPFACFAVYYGRRFFRVLREQKVKTEPHSGGADPGWPEEEAGQEPLPEDGQDVAELNRLKLELEQLAASREARLSTDKTDDENPQ